jgi:Tfp pilus assembly protein PilX
MFLSRRPKRLPRGVALVAFVAALLIIGTLVLWLFQLTASTSAAASGHFLSTGAYYAAESGIEMALRELTRSPPTDIDSDGTIGTISDNANVNDDPVLATGAVHVEKLTTTPPTYRATGRTVQTAAPWSSYRRIIEVRMR